MASDARIRRHLETAQMEIDKALQLLDTGDEVIEVGPGDNLLSAIEQAPAGATLALDPAYVGELGYWTLSKPLTLMTAGAVPLERVTASYAGPLLSGILTIDAPEVTLLGLRLTLPGRDGTAITAGRSTTLDRCLVTGSLAGGHRGIAVNAPDITISRCHVAAFWSDQDTQAVCGWMHTRNLLVDDCYLEASGENVLFGGADGPDEASIPQDILVTDCTLSKPEAWRDKRGCTVKNLYELKNAKRATLRRSTLERVWAHGQAGYALVLTVRNQENSNPWATIEDCVVEACTLRSMAGGVQILGRDDGAGGPSQVMRNLILRGNHFSDISPADYGTNGRQLFISGGPRDLVVADNVWSGGPYLNSAISFDQPEHPLEGFVYTGNTAHEGSYGIFGTGAPGLGVPALEYYCPSGYRWDSNTIIDDGDGWIRYPPGTEVIPPGRRRGPR